MTPEADDSALANRIYLAEAAKTHTVDPWFLTDDDAPDMPEAHDEMHIYSPLPPGMSLDRALKISYERGRGDERADVVRFLITADPDEWGDPSDVAQAIEAGDHRR